MIKTTLFLAGAAVGVFLRPCSTSPPSTSEDPAESADVEGMLQDFVDDYAEDAHAQRSFLFGIRIRDAEVPEWHVEVRGGDQPETFLYEGFPDEPIP